MRYAFTVMVAVTSALAAQLVGAQDASVVLSGNRVVDEDVFFAINFHNRVAQEKSGTADQSGQPTLVKDRDFRFAEAAPQEFGEPTVEEGNKEAGLSAVPILPADPPVPISYYDPPLPKDAEQCSDDGEPVADGEEDDKDQDYVFSSPLGEGDSGCAGGCDYDLVGDSLCDYGCDCNCGGDGSCTNVSRWSFGGWMAAGVYDNDQGLDGPNGNSPLGFNNLAEEFQLHQAGLYAAREADNGGSGWGWGFRADFMFGTDGPDTQAFGDGSWDASWDTSGQYGFAMPQLYGELVYDDWRVKIGHFYTIIGYEVVQAPDNFFYSHAYTMVYNEPFTHTGILVEKPINDMVTLYGGYTFGWDTGFDNRNDGSTFLGGIGLQLTDNMSATYATSFGDPGDNPAGSSETYLHSLVIDWSLTDRLNYVFQNDFQTRNSTTAGGKTYGINQYLFYKLTDKLSAGMRYEWFRDSRGAVAVAGASEHFQALSMGLNFKVRDNLWVKPEMRYDWTDRDDAFAGAAFDGGTEGNMFFWGSQLIYTF